VTYYDLAYWEIMMYSLIE